MIRLPMMKSFMTVYDFFLSAIGQNIIIDYNYSLMKSGFSHESVKFQRLSLQLEIISDVYSN